MMRTMLLISALITFALLGTIPSSAQWLPLNSQGLNGLSHFNLNDVLMLNSTTFIVVGDSGGIILRCMGGGAVWTIGPSLPTTHRLNAIGGDNTFSQQLIYAVGDSVVCRSSDGGRTWSGMIMPYRFTAVGISPPYWGLNVFLGTDSGTVLSSNSGTSDWTEVRKFRGGKIIAFGFRAAPLNTYALTIASQLYTYTSEFEATNFDSISNVSPMWDFIVGADVSSSIQYLVGGTGDFALTPLVLRRSISDTTWTRFVNLPFGNYLNDVYAFRDTALVYVCGTSGKIFVSTDSAHSWTEQSTGTTHNLCAITFADPMHGVAVGDSGTILCLGYSGPTGIGSEGSHRPAQYSLEQNYPNPFNPATDFRFSIANLQLTILKVYDILGKEVATLVNEVRQPGEYTVRWDASSIPSGVYFYRLTAGRFSDVKKMILMK